MMKRFMVSFRTDKPGMQYNLGYVVDSDAPEYADPNYRYKVRRAFLASIQEVLLALEEGVQPGDVGPEFRRVDIR